MAKRNYQESYLQILPCSYRWGFRILRNQIYNQCDMDNLKCFYERDFSIKIFLTVDTDVIISMTFSIAIVVITSWQAFQEQLSAVIFTFYRNIEIT